MNFVPPSCIFDDQPPDRPEWSFFSAALGALAAFAVFEEAALSPKPGLICPDSPGGHKDMNWAVFAAGAAAVSHFWRRQAMDGLRLGHYKPFDGLAEKLRETGREMERAMYGATGGLNTHKGLIFAMSLLLGACGVCARAGVFTSGDILRTAGSIIAARVTEDLAGVARAGARGKELTHGERIYLEYGIGGIRTEAAGGFASVRRGLEALDAAMSAGASFKDAAVRVLLLMMTCCEDTNVIYRGGVDFWRGEYAERVRETYGRFDPLEPEDYEPVRALGKMLAERSVSPGGAADMLACTLFMYRSKIMGNTAVKLS